LHEPPDEEKLADLKTGLALLGFHTGNLAIPSVLAKFLKDTQNHPLRYHAHTMVLRSMKRAVYSAEKIGHFGLAKEYYAHFTSPIRRYPDLVLHRQLADYLDGKGGKMPQGYLMATAQLATEREQIADDASRQLIEIKKFRYLQQQLDEKKPIEYRAVVAKCTNYGVFIDIPELAMGGMIHISNLSQQYVRFNPSAETLNAGGVTYRIGTVVKVQVAKVDFNQRRADFMLVDGPKPAAGDEEKREERPARKGRGREERAPRKENSREERQPRTSSERPSREAKSRPPRDAKKPAPFRKFERKKK
jgi:ribonuclease R